jgi:DtxR family Mn-dependent transcriptional regulator
MKKVHESSEDYLEAILKLHIKKGEVHAIDVVNDLGVSKPSVSVALKHLSEEGYLSVDEYRHIILSDKGQELASKILNRHVTIASFLEKLGVSEQNALLDACKMEHDISEESFARIQAFLKK